MTDFFIMVWNGDQRRHLQEAFRTVHATNVEFDDLSVSFSLETAEQVSQLMASYDLRPGNGKPRPD